MTGFGVATVLAVGVGMAIVRAVTRRRRLQQNVLLQACVAPVVELIAAVVGAGGSVGEAIAVVAAEGPEPARKTFAAVVEHQRTGELLADALVIISSELGSAFHPLASSLIAANQGGAPVGLVLQRLADEAQQARARATTDALGRLPVAMLLPLVVCQLPALVIGSVIPLTIVALGQLGW